MKRLIFIFLLFSFIVKGQVYQAGTLSPAYIDIIPDTLINVWQLYPGPPDESYSIDINGDNQNDVKIHSNGIYSPGGTSAYIEVVPLNTNLYTRFGRVDSVYHNWYGYWMVSNVAKPLLAGDTINKTNAGWSNSALTMLNTSGYAGSYINIKDWVNTSDEYIGIKYQMATDTLYGWIRVFVPDAYNCYVKDFSFQSTCHVVPSLNTASSSSLICSGETATLSANGVSTYTWSTGANGQNIIVTPTITTNYTVSGTTSNGCLLSSIITQSVNACIGIKEYDKSILSIYPNPANNKLLLKGIEEIKKCLLIAPDGKEIPLKQNQNNEFDVSIVQEGIYFLQVHTTEGILTRKIIIQR